MNDVGIHTRNGGLNLTLTKFLVVRCIFGGLVEYECSHQKYEATKNFRLLPTKIMTPLIYSTRSWEYSFVLYNYYLPLFHLVFFVYWQYCCRASNISCQSKRRAGIRFFCILYCPPWVDCCVLNRAIFICVLLARISF